ncbi:MAG TPA: type IV toxin-antitoxin system AbiEi family antitoxin domain-containing protein [Streptosporangiaceae bacterium]|nr:type IV toxin-antitoxin system AbiEi family antitoxin domain-containing protein [Streptosporangiaceae bacterium]
MPVNVPQGLRELLIRQCGVATRQQALDAGLPATAVDNQLRSRRWQQLQRGVYACFSGSPAREAELWAAVLRAGEGSALSYRTAAELYGLDRGRGPGGPIHVTVPASRRAGLIRGGVLHVSGSVATTRHPVLLPPRTRIDDTVIDLTQVSATFDEAFDWVCRAVGRRLTTPAHLTTTLQARPRVRWRADLLAVLADAGDGAQSNLELRYIRHVERAHGLPAARRQMKIVTGNRARYLDNFYEEAKLAVELDGRAAHPPEQRWSDSHRDNEHASLGIMTVRYNWHDVNYRACEIAAQVSGLLRMRGSVVKLRRCGPACTAACTPAYASACTSARTAIG